MAVKPADSTVAQQVCRVCGGEVNPHGECVVCGTKQDAPTTTDKGLPSWLKNESGEASTWLSAPGIVRWQALEIIGPGPAPSMLVSRSKIR
ncbi:MAG: hypothetical protein E6J96_04590 [Methanobacteriota archaeon]|nr:MAG: hypothetical protein E6J96_04590 [Euryarchaeota archaeon]